MNNKLLIGVVAAVVVIAAGVVLWLTLGGDDEALERGSCEDGVTYELSAEEDDGALEVAFELQSAGPAEAWTVEFTQGGTSLLEADRQTDEDGELDVDVLADPDGSDEFTVTATPENGTACTAALAR
ncbi:hypothetical protein [Nocardioides nanhaiensis]|uniref:Uncharacterized protein n=1 Tax=Nocardioides nanhaiensis TaxID=1476871 RepID=A0ABP8WIU6_9ACTN